MLNSIPLFIHNKSFKVYNQIIEKAKSESRKKGQGIYYESHHILPTALGGSDTKENKVLLTGKEHYLCHRLLVNCTEGLAKRSMTFALKAYLDFNNDFQTEGRYKPPSRIVGLLRERASKEMSKVHKGRKLTQEHKDKIAASMKKHVRTEEHKRNNAEALRKTDKNMGKTPWHKGKTGVYSKETLAKMSAAKKGKPGNVTMLGKKHSEETKAKMKAAQKERWAKKKASQLSPS